MLMMPATGTSVEECNQADLCHSRGRTALCAAPRPLPLHRYRWLTDVHGSRASRSTQAKLMQHQQTTQVKGLLVRRTKRSVVEAGVAVGNIVP